MFRINRLMLAVGCITLGGCQSLWQPQTAPVKTVEPATECVFVIQTSAAPVVEPSITECSMYTWLTYWKQQAKRPWRERKQALAALSSSSSDQLRAFILAQPTDTPYQYRLRAQYQFETLQPLLSVQFSELLRELAYEPSQQLLEYESAITILSEVNTRQTKEIKEQAQLLQEQEEKLNQLLSIEAKILENTLEQ